MKRKYKYLQIGIASPEEIISWANPELQGKDFTYDPLHKDRVTYTNEAGEKVEYIVSLSLDLQKTINVHVVSLVKIQVNAKSVKSVALN